MKKTAIYHVCLSSHEEVMFRSPADLYVGFNCLAVAALSTESRLLADGFLTTHYHVLLQTSDLKEVIYRTRNAYSRHFNTKYSRTGRLGEKKYFSLEIDGLNHSIAAINYVLRQGIHHGLSTTPFEYPYCSANTYFRQELGKVTTPSLISKRSRHKYLPSNIKIPLEYRMSAEGQLLREDILDVKWVEQNYVSPKSFLLNMNRIADAADILKQQKENQLPPVTMETIEAGVPNFVLQEAQSFERERGVRNNMTDLELCSYIDTELVPRLLKNPQSASIYNISESKRAELYEWIWRKYNEVKWKKIPGKVFSGKTLSEVQLRRCLVL
ncbi:MAG: hypothetical protein J6T58_00530 [Bacteroidales bacterium]|nr:hypothetical protein [Bacteroidales bacterium]